MFRKFNTTHPLVRMVQEQAQKAFVCTYYWWFQDKDDSDLVWMLEAAIKYGKDYEKLVQGIDILDPLSRLSYEEDL